MAATVFISYAHQDGADLAGRLLQDLTQRGTDVWLDTARLNGGSSWTIEIEQALDRCEFVLAILSRASYLSDICRAEQLRSLRRGKCLIPVLAQTDAERPIHLESKQFLDFSLPAAYPAEFARLLDCIQFKSGATLPGTFRHTYITVPPLPSNYIERTAELHSLRAIVLRDGASRRVALTALKGMAGIGKTVLAQALCLDEIMQAAFPDGIVWLTIGKDLRDPVPLLREAGKAVGDSLDGYDSLQSASNRLRNCLRAKAAFLVLDDVWESRDIAPFLFDSPKSRLMITTRDARTAVALGAEQQALTVLTKQQSLELLALWAGYQIEQLPPEASEIVRECGRLPLAVAMVGAQLRGKPDRWPHMLHKLRSADLDRIRQSFPEYPHPDLLRAIDLSMDALPGALRGMYLDLAVFPEDSSVPEAAVASLWNLDEYDAADAVDQLVDLSLLTRDIDRRLRIHDLMLDYLRRCLGADGLLGRHKQLLQRYAQRCSGNWAAGPDDGYFFQNLIWHLRSAERTEEALALLTNFAWVRAKLDACGIALLISDLDWSASRDPNARLLQEALRLSAYVLSADPRQLNAQLLGRIVENSSPVLDTLRAEASSDRRHPWLRPLRRLLTPPGGALVFTLAGHTARVRSLALTPDRANAVSASDDHTIKVWNLHRGQLERTISGHTDAVRAIAVLPDGAHIISGSDDHTLRVWDLATGAQQLSIDLQLDWVRGLVALPGTSCVASISDDRVIRIWDISLQTVVRLLRGHTAEVSCAAAIPASDLLITGSADRTVRLWTADGRCSSVLKGHTARLAAVAASGPNQILSISEDGTALLWRQSAGTWQAQRLPWKPQAVRSASLSADGSRAIAGSDDGNVHVWDLAAETELLLEGHSDWVNCVSLAPDGFSAASGSDDGTLKLWDLTRAPASLPVKDHLDRVRSVAITADCASAVSTSDDHTLRLWDLSTQTVKAVIRNQHHWVFAFLPNTENILIYGGAGSFSLWDLHSNTELQRFTGHLDRVRCLVVTPDGKRVISGADDQTIRVWDIQSAQQLLTIPLTRQWPRSLALTADGRFIVTAAESNSLKLWDLSSGAELRTFRGHTARINSVAITAGGLLVSASDDHTLRVWNVASAVPLHVLKAHDNRVNSVSLLADGPYAVSAADDADINLWDLDKGTLLAAVTLESPVLTCAGSTCGRTIVAGDRSGLVHFISVEAISPENS